MSKFALKTARFWNELRRRKTVGTAIGYIILLVAVVSPASDILAGLGAPEWVLRYLIIALLIGFPIALVLSWMFDFTLHGFERTKILDEDEVHEEEAEESSANTEGLDADELQSNFILDSVTAQRRQVTLLKCTFQLMRDDALVDDPESMIDIVDDIELLVSDLCKHYDAVKNSQQDTTFELLFGYPSLYENDAIRAVATGLAILKDVQDISTRAGFQSNEKITASIAVHSDVVVVDSKEGESKSFSVAGSAMQVTSWLQTFAQPDSVVLDDSTFELLRNRFKCELLGDFSNTLIGHEVSIYNALEIREASTVIDPLSKLDSVFLGRESEISLVRDQWERAQDGEDKFVILRGEAGIGKSTIVRETIALASESGNPHIMSMFCSPLEKNTALQPIVEYMMGPGIGLRKTTSDSDRLAKIEEVLANLEIDVEKAAPLIASLLLFEKDESKGVATTNESSRKELLNYLLELFRATAADRPLLLIIEDLHWADPSTLEILNMLVSDGSKSGMLCLVTSRPTLHLEWESRSNVTTLNLEGLSNRSSDALVSHYLRDIILPDEVKKRIREETGGNPLFAQELAKAVFEAASNNQGYDISDLVLPGTLQRSLASRIDNLGAAKPLLQLCSLLGREFDYSLLKDVSGTVEEGKLKQELKQLVNSDFLNQNGSFPDCKFIFRHILMQETAYQSLLKSTRKELHSRVAEKLELLTEKTGEASSVVLAYHYEHSDQFEKAIECLSISCNKAMATFALREAIELAGTALKLLVKLPKSEARDVSEIGFLALLGKALVSLGGYGEPKVEETFSKALALSKSVKQQPQLFKLLVGLWAYLQIAGSPEEAAEVADQLLEIASQEDFPAKTVQALYCSGYSQYRRGNFKVGSDSLEQALNITTSVEDDYSQYSPTGDDLRAQVRLILAQVLWYEGCQSKAYDLYDEAIAIAYELESQVGIVIALFHGAWLMQLDRNIEKAIELSGQCFEVATNNDLKFWAANSRYIQAWARFYAEKASGESDGNEFLDMMINHVNKIPRKRFGVLRWSLEICEALLLNERIVEARAWCDKANEAIGQLGDEYLRSEVYRVEGLLLAAEGKKDRAIEKLEKARKHSQEKGCNSLYHRATSNLVVLFNKLGEDERSEQLASELAEIQITRRVDTN